MASIERRMTEPPGEVSSATAGANAITTVTLAAINGVRHNVMMVIVSANGAIAAGVRVTLAWTKDGTAMTIGLQLPPVSLGPVILNFGDHPVEGDDNTAVTLTIPALGGGISGEGTLIGFKAQV